MRTLRVARLAVLALVLGYVVSLLPQIRTHADDWVMWDIGAYVVASWAAPPCAGCACARFPADRVAWACVAAGLTSYGVGTLLYYTILVRLPEVPYPSPADALWLALYPLKIVGVALLVRARMAGSVLSTWLDGIVSGLGLTSVSATFVFPRLTEGAAGPPAAIVTNFAYPLLDLALLATVIGAMAALGDWRNRSWTLLGVGFLTFAAADSWYLLQIAAGTYQFGSPVDAVYLVAVTLVALSASITTGSGVAARSETRSFLVPGFAALLAVAVLVVEALRASATVALGVALCVGALSAAGLRTVLAVREVVRLSDSRPAGALSPPTSVVDLDRFKETNDALGRHVGDLLLPGRQRPLARPARGAAAQMAVLMPGLSTDGAVDLCRRLLSALEEPFAVDDLALHLGASIGITAMTAGKDVGRALAEADLAMYRAKAARSGWEVYDQVKDGNAWDRLATVEALRTAITSGDLGVAFQPIVQPHALRPTSVEALIRWTHPVRGVMPPDTFLPLAEQAGLMPAVTRAVLDLSLDQALELRRMGWSLPVLCQSLRERPARLRPRRVHLPSTGRA